MVAKTKEMDREKVMAKEMVMVMVIAIVIANNIKIPIHKNQQIKSMI